MDLVWR